MKDESAARFLAESPRSLLKQSNCNPKSLQTDGWGVAQWKPKTETWDLIRSPNPIYKERTRFQTLAKRIDSTLTLAHIRKASNPGGLPRSELIGLRHTQPFRYKNLAFVHNGTLNIPQEMARTLGRFRPSIAGNNDSEVLFWLIVKIWSQLGGASVNKTDWKRIFLTARAQLQKIWKSIPLRKRKHAHFAHGLNIIVSDGRSIAAQCSYSGTESGSLCDPKRPYFEMCYNKDRNAAVIASEPLEGSGSWRSLRNGNLLIIEPLNGELSARSFQIHK